MLTASYLLELGIKNIINYNRKSRQDEELERRTGEDTLKSIRDLMDRILLPLGIPYDQQDEIGSGDKISTRPVFQGVIEDLRNNKYQAIAVKEISRMGRGSYTDMGIIYDLIVGNRIFIITPWKVYDPQNGADLRQIRFELFMSREEFETTRERLTGGRYNKAIEGRWMAGSPPFGYDLNRQTRKLEINDETSAVVRLIFVLYINGIPMEDGTKKDVGYRALCTYLKRIGIKTPVNRSDWRTDNVKYILSNPAYIGTMRYRRTQTVGNKAIERPEHEHVVVENAHPPIVDMETWELAQEKVNRKSYTPRVRLDHTAHELTGIIICKVCGNRMIRQHTWTKYKSQKTGEVNKYEKEFLWCTRTGCTFVKYRAVEEDLIDTMKEIQSMDKTLIKDVINQLVNKEKRQNKTSDDIAQFKEKKLNELKQRMKFIYEKYESGIYSDEMFLDRKKEIDKEMENLNKISNNNDDVEDIEKEIDYEALQNKIGSFIDAYENTSDTGLRNSILRQVFDYAVVEIIEKGRGSRPAKHVLYPVVNPGILES